MGGHDNGSNGNVEKPKRIEYFVENNIEIGSVYATDDRSAAISVDRKDLYVWGNSNDGPYGSSKSVPERMELLNDSKKIVSIGLGTKFIGILRESKEESKEDEVVLKGGEEMTVKNQNAHNVYVQNEELFGNDDWIQIKQSSNYLLFPYFGHKFVENLVMNKDKNMIELIEYSEIDEIYISDIIGSQFFVSSDAALNVIKNEQETKEFASKAQNYSFDKIEEITFKIPAIEISADNADQNQNDEEKDEHNEKCVHIYVRPKNAKSIYLLKQIQL